MTRKPHEKTLLLAEYLSKKPEGARLSYVEIEESTGVRMDVTGKGYLRSALKMSHIETLNVKGYGIELVCADTAVEAVGKQFVMIDNSVKRGRKVTQNIASQFNTKMNEQDRNKVSYAISIFGAIEASADSYRAMRKLEKFREKQVTPYIPPTVSSYKSVNQSIPKKGAIE